MRIIVGFAIFLSLALTLYPRSVLAADCHLLKAVYAPIDSDNHTSTVADDRYRARHVSGRRELNQASYTLRIVEERQNIYYNFGFSYPNEYGGIALVFLGAAISRSVYRRKSGDPESSILYFGPDLRSVTPEAENPSVAPTMLIMPELGRAFWNWGPGKRAFVPPTGLWAITSCDP